MNRNHNSGRASSLPWWTWILPFFIANLGTWLSIWFKTDPGASLWYLPTALGIVMIYWWGPRVLLGVYLNAVVCAPLWDLPAQWSLLYALPETIEVGLSWLLFIKIAGGKYWLPDLKNVGVFLLFGSLVPTFLANAYLVMQLHFLGDIAQSTIWDNWQILFSGDLTTQFVIAVPLLVLFTRLMREKGWIQTDEPIPPLFLLPHNRNSLRDRIFILTIFTAALIMILMFSIHDLWILYGFLMILIAIRYGVNMAVIGTSWIGLLAFLIPVILTGKLGLSTALYGDFVSTNFYILFLCGVALLTGRAISDLFMVLTERGHVEKELRSSEELHRVTLSNISDTVFITEDNGNFTYVCPNVNVLFGYSQAEVFAFGNIGKLLGYDLFDSQELDARTEIQNIERQIRTKAGEQRVVLVNVKRVSIHGGTVLHTCHDITERKQAENKIQEQLERLHALRDIDQAITSTFDMESSLSTLLACTTRLLEVDASAVMLLNSVESESRYRASIGFRTDALQNAKVSFNESFAGRVALEQKIIHIPDMVNEPNKHFADILQAEEFVSYYGVPLTVKGKVIGALEVFHRSPLDRDQEWLDFLSTLAGQAAIAIDSAQLFTDLQDSNMELSLAYDATIEGWSHALDLRDKETEGHTQRVTNLTMELARRIGISGEQLIQVQRGSLLHDIGKMGVPDNILLKPGSLTDEEWHTMKKHPTFAREMLSAIRYLKSAAVDIPYCHHEKWDGSGYPRGLKGEQIPLAARLFSVMDVWDAVTSDRPYRPAWAKDKALEYIREQSGKHFDPQVVDAFLGLIGDKAS